MKIWNYCRQTLHQSELEAESKSVNFIRAFNSLKKHKIEELKSLEDKSIQIDDYEALLIETVASLEDDLMNLEMLLQDALYESTSRFKELVTAKNMIMKNKSIDYIKEVVSFSDQFHTTLKNLGLIEQV